MIPRDGSRNAYWRDVSHFEKVNTIDLRTKRIIVVLAVIGLVSAGGVVLFAYSQIGNVSSNHLNGQIGISERASSVYIWDGNAWTAAKFTTSGNSLNVSAGNIPVNASEIVVFANNPAYDVESFLNSSYYYQYNNVVTAGMNLTSAYSYIGTDLNSSSNNNVNNKGVQDVAIQQLLYDNSTNNLGKSVKFSLYDLAGAPLKDTQVFIFHFQKPSNATTASFGFTNYEQQPFQSNILDAYSAAIIVMAIVLIVSIAVAYPRRRR